MKPGEHYPVPRSCMLLLLGAQLAALAPHVERLPWALLVVAGLSLGWRLLIHGGRGVFPGRVVRYGLALLVMLAIAVFYRKPGLEPAVALLVGGASLKLLEMRSRRDVILVVTLGYFITATQCLFSQTLLTALWLLLPFMLATGALAALHGESIPVATALRKAAALMLQAVPLMVVLFLVFPRLGPLWSVPMPEGQARTGLSDSMSPGDFDRLMQSDALAFRARFEGAQPKPSDLYWRAMTYEVFDGRRWSMWEGGGSTGVSWSGKAEPQPSWRYEVLLEPSPQPWLVVLDQVRQVSPSARWVSDGSLRATKPLLERYRYHAESVLAPFQPALPPAVHKRNLMFPSGNPQATAWAQQQWARQPQVEAYVGTLLQHFRTQGFNYTLTPPALGRDPVDGFLFGSRSGFCEHYASATAFLLRSVGIPARVVAGYQGGQYNAEGGYWRVNQYDAHAWVEYWQTGRGWLRLDPTAAVSPDRIDWGSLQLLDSQGALSGVRSLRHGAVLSWVGLRWDQLNYAWQRHVVAYDGTQREQLFSRLDSVSLDWRSLTYFALLVVLVLLAGMAVALGLRRGDPVQRHYDRACARFARAGLPRQAGEGPNDYCARVAGGSAYLRRQFGEITALYCRLQYGPPLAQPERAALLRQLKQQVAALRVGQGRLR